jgi:cobalt-zinc-cadmium resistance protein CzcA
LDTNFISIHPSLQALEKELSALKQSKKVEKAIAMPDFSIAYNNQSITGVQTINNEEMYFDEKDRFSSVSLGISIPISYGTNKAKLKSLEYQIQARDAHVKQQELLLSAQLKNILVQYRQDVLQFNYYRDLALPKIEETVKAAQLGYRTGEISYVEYLYTLQTAKDMRLNYLKSILQINQSAIAYLNLTNQ